MKRVKEITPNRAVLDLPNSIRLPSYDVAKKIIREIHQELKQVDQTLVINYGRRTPLGNKSTCKSTGKESEFRYYFRQLDPAGDGVLCFSPNFECTGKEFELEEGLLAKRRKLGTRPDDDQEINLPLDLRLFGQQHRELQSSNTHYANCCSFMFDSGIRPFRFIGSDPILSKLLFFPVSSRWEELRDVYLAAVRVSDILCFVTSAGQLLMNGMTCAQLYEVNGLSTIYVIPAASIPPPEDEGEDKEDADVFDDLEDLIPGFEDEQPCNRRSGIRTVTVEERAKIRALFPPGADENELVASVRRRDLQTLRGRNWLNEEIVNAYMELLNKRDGCRTLYAFSSYFYLQLEIGGFCYENVEQWTTFAKVDIFTLERLLFPVRVNAFWTLAVVNLKEQRFEYRDSLGGTNESVLANLKLWLKEESKAKRGMEIDLHDWGVCSPRTASPQTKEADCGAWTLNIANHVALGKSFEFGHVDIPNFRLLAILQLLQQSLEA